MRPAILTPLLVLALLAGSLHAAPVNVIFDTDMNGDVDDVGALAVLNKLTNFGEARMLACVTDAIEPQKATGGTIQAINSYYGHGDVPIGTYHGTKYGYSSVYDGPVRDKFEKSFPTDDQLPTALEIYRKALAAAPDHSVTIVTVGILENLPELLQSPADAISPLTGMELVKRKVKNLVSMAGQFPASGVTGGECNMCAGSNDGFPGQYVAENWPTPILYSGFEIGAPIVTGIPLKDSPANDPVRLAYDLYTHFKGRSSWDPTAVLAAVRDPHLYWDIKEDGYNWVSPIGTNKWFPTPHRGHSYLVTKMPPAQLAAVLNDLMTRPPGPAK
jgi:hypothetical protein